MIFFHYGIYLINLISAPELVTIMRRINKLHLIAELEFGGTEDLLVNIGKKMNKENYCVIVGYIYGPSTLVNQIRLFGVEVGDLSWRGKIDPLVIFKLFFLIKRQKIDYSSCPLGECSCSWTHNSEIGWCKDDHNYSSLWL